MYCAKGDYPHVQYAFCLHALDAQLAVKCGMASVTWCDVTANHLRATHSIPHFTFSMPQFRILPTAVGHWLRTCGSAAFGTGSDENYGLRLRLGFV